jgi:hypothetical protein
MVAGFMILMKNHLVLDRTNVFFFTLRHLGMLAQLV